MVSEGSITRSEGIALLETLYSIEDMGSYESDVEVEDPRYLPPWESEEGELHELLGQNKCARAIASANKDSEERQSLLEKMDRLEEHKEERMEILRLLREKRISAAEAIEKIKLMKE
jgi:hypothetical protein